MDSKICICKHYRAGIKKCENLAERLDEKLASLVQRVMVDWSDALHLQMVSDELVEATLVSAKHGGSPKLARELLVETHAVGDYLCNICGKMKALPPLPIFELDRNADHYAGRCGQKIR